MLLFVRFQGKAGICRISDCPQFGKFLKRLDNHLLASHPGVTRGENDNKPLKLTLVNKTRVKCLLRGCEKEVIHFKQHLKNRHKMGMEDYVKIISEKEAGIFYESSTSSQSLTTSEIPGSTHSTPESLAPVQYPSPSFTPESPAFTVSSFNLSSPSEYPIPPSPPPSHRIFNADEHEIRELADDEFSFERFCYLKHQTTHYGLLAMCSHLRAHSMSNFYASCIRRDIFGEISLQTLTEIYQYRRYLVAFYRKAKYACYPFDIKDLIIGNCLACGTTKNEDCECPVATDDFYKAAKVYCCPEIYSCKRCLSPHGKGCGVHTDCIDFYHCKICNESNKTRNELQAKYPSIYGRHVGLGRGYSVPL
ncbi:Hypothetical predicted protein [Paramuricea clavata]|uniref:Uncharacterized protein n=1 Tax=Paramuricea clavata TaxID=317549 RepID=A0A6S7H0P6_PARCT|nr:Hypothetical predicted protein [Paramuricea clavata]